jgi:2-methylcitrate dehydratase PrpD
MNSSLTRALTTILEQPISADDRARASAHLLDWLGCAAIGSRSEQAATLREYLAQYVAEYTATSPRPALALGLGAMAWDDALAYNAALGNVAEMDDLHRQSVLHAGPVVVPAALACAQLLGASPVQLLDAIVRGYEVAIRIGRALGTDHYALFHNTSTCGAFGAAAAAASLLGLTPDQQVWALGNAGTRTGGLWQLRHESTMSKQLHTAEAARTGVQAALLAAKGFTGPSQILEGPQGFFAAMSPAAQPEAVVADEERWLMYACSFKPWPACRHTHSAIDVARLGRLEIADLAAVESIALNTYSDALTFCDRPEPSTENEAKFSLQHSIAVALLHDKPQLEHFYPQYLADPAVAALRAKVKVALGADIDTAYREHWGAELTITLAGGEVIRQQCRDALGDPECPLSAEQLAEKAQLLLAAGGMADEPAQALIQATLALPAAADLDHFNHCFGVALEQS